MIYCRISEFIFQKFLLPRGVEEKYKSIYAYGFEVVLSRLVEIIVLFTVSYILDVFPEMLCFFATFIPLRLYGGGAHASSHSRCLVLFSFSMLSSIAVGTIISVTEFYRPILIFFVICCMYFQFRFSRDRHKKLRYKNQPVVNFFFPWLISLAAVISLFLPIEPKYAVISVFGIYVQAISLIINYFKEVKL